ncbi:YtxH domain-containing protein [Tissierella sp. Yu-01]|jgi:gas vesicle protein|uniref:YtxH domain-containing protein n=1 Tax=Tissierella sp. Yu-01 TaxID=3035694 RepID=UPI00240D27CC|nr:YtxH domain-containing protein [Tissierella sp. Yu-01]WFA09435.1 YtxH domain-containing protein [Tissierella sp. Yu-01]
MKLNKIIEEKRRQMEKAKKRETAKHVAVGTAIGTALGAAAGILFAPKSGKETREDIATKSKDVAETVKQTATEQMGATKEWSQKIKNDVKKNINEIKEKKKVKTEEIIDDINTIVEATNEGIATVEEILEETDKEIKDELNK